MDRIKLIWDFRGGDAAEMARHHARHLEDYAEKHRLTDSQCGVEQLSDQHSIAWMSVNPENMLDVRDALRPHRGEQHTSQS